MSGGVSNMLATYGTDRYIRQYENEVGLPWKDMEAYLRISYPSFHPDRTKARTLFSAVRSTSMCLCRTRSRCIRRSVAPRFRPGSSSIRGVPRPQKAAVQAGPVRALRRLIRSVLEGSEHRRVRKYDPSLAAASGWKSDEIARAFRARLTHEAHSAPSQGIVGEFGRKNNIPEPPGIG